MHTRLSRICDAVIEAGWLAALVVTPLFFNTYSNRVFEPDKLHLLRSIALVMAVAWVTQLLDLWLSGGDRQPATGAARAPGLWTHIRSTPLVLPALILSALYLVSTLFSLVPRISLEGSYVRLQGTFTFLSYVVIFAMVLTHLRTRAQVNRILHAVILTSLPVSIYGLVQRFGLDPLPWGGDVTVRVAGNMGNAIFVAAYLIMAFFLTLERLVDSLSAVLSADKGSSADALRAGGYLFLLAVQLLTIVFTLSRGPWIGLAAGGYMFGLLGVLLVARWAVGRPRAPRWLGRAVRPVWLGLIGLSALSVAFVIVLNIPNGPLESLRERRYIERLSTIFNIDQGTNKVRVLIWEGAVDMMLKPHAPLTFPPGTTGPWWAPAVSGDQEGTDTLNALRPLIGYGPESMWVAYNRFYPPDLAHFEQRNASPDRSHNETFDAVVRTGLLGFGAQLFLFGSIFYYALRWLGLIRGRGRRLLFLGFVGGGAAAGVILPALLDHSLRLAGIGLPAGLIIGVLLYVTVDVVLTPTAASGIQEAEKAEDAHTTLERQLLVLALFSALVAHFIEIQIGIAIASTLTHFWILSAVLVVVGMGWIERGKEPVAETGTVASRMDAQTRTKSQTVVAGKRTAKSRKPALRDLPQQRGVALGGSSSAGGRGLTAAARSSVRSFLPYAGIAMIITLTLTWDYLINQSGAKTAAQILWEAFATRVNPSTKAVEGSPMMMVLMIFTWVVGGVWALAESRRLRATNEPFKWGANAAIYGSAAFGTFVVYGLAQAGRTLLTGLSGMDVFHRIAGHIAFFDGALLVFMLVLAAFVALADPRPRPSNWFNGLPVLPLGGGILAAVVALVIVVNANIKIVQADTYYKQGLAFEGAGSWESAIILYDQAAKLEPQEDYYYLFLGRALLEYSGGATAGNAVLPADVSQMPTEDLLPLVERALQIRDREDLMRATNAVLLGAQRLNPLNTDHSANLARLFRSWAFTDALKPTDSPSNQLLRQLASSKTEGVDLDKLEKSLGYYRVATKLSPQNAQLWNEMAAVQYIQGDIKAALASLNHSVSLDQLYYQTHLLRADMMAEDGDKEGALEAYRQASALRKGTDITILGAIGVYAAQTGHIDEALTSFGSIIEKETAALTDTQNKMGALELSVSQMGGIDKAGQTAKNQRTSLQNSINNHRAQLHLAYRNKALVLRDAGRTAEALQAAQSALDMATEAQRSAIQQLIDELRKTQSPG